MPMSSPEHFIRCGRPTIGSNHAARVDSAVRLETVTRGPRDSVRRSCNRGMLRRFPARIVCCFVALLACVDTARAERLPIKAYTVAEGLARNRTNRVVRDSRGFLWICTAEGLSRFDGYRFVNFSTDAGLPHASVTDLLETKAGVYWVATLNGVARLDPATSTFVAYSPGENEAARHVIVLREDRAGTIWVGTSAGLFRLEAIAGRVSFRFVPLGTPQQSANPAVEAILADKEGALWVGTDNGLYRLWPERPANTLETIHGLPVDQTHALIEDEDGSVWVGTSRGVCHLALEPDRRRVMTARIYTTGDGLAYDWIFSLFRSSDHRLWVGTGYGLSELVAGVREVDHRFRSYLSAQGLSGITITALTEDRAGNLWLGTMSTGIMRLARHGFTTYSEADGLFSEGAGSLYESHAGELCTNTGPQMGGGRIYWFDGRRFVSVQPSFPTRIRNFGEGWNQITFQDHTGEWWIPTGQGLCRFAKAGHVMQLAGARPKSVYTTRDGLITNDVFRLFEDSRGDVWIGNQSPGVALRRWQRTDEVIYRYTERDGLPPQFLPMAFAEDMSGHVWIGSMGGGVARQDAEHFNYFTTADGAPRGAIRAMYVDHAGRLWIASAEGGLGRVDDPSADRPRFVRMTTADGLASNDLWSLTEDRWGRIYVGTGRGLDRLDPTSGRTKHYSGVDGLAEVEIQAAHRYRDGSLWFAGVLGAARFVPAIDEHEDPPTILITGLRFNGVPQNISALGQEAVAGVRLGFRQDNIEVEFVGLPDSLGDRVRYQYRLEGADTDWSRPTDDYRVNYANMAPGRYHFVVRALAEDGTPSPMPASFTFELPPPIWRRWWVLASVAVLVAAAAYLAARSRMLRLVELERVRTRIAADLHDDMGSALSRLAILSEVIKRQMGSAPIQTLSLLDDMGATARGMVDGMSDIVWSIDPRHDDLASFAARVRQFASVVLEAQGIQWTIEVPAHPERVKLDPQQRRHLFLMCKEAITNVLRHAVCRTVTIAVSVCDQQIVLDIRDDGRGLEIRKAPNALNTGHGLENLQVRAAELGGSCGLQSGPERGTHLHIEFPLRRGAA